MRAISRPVAPLSPEQDHGRQDHQLAHRPRRHAPRTLRWATQSLYRSPTALGEYFRRKRARLGTPQAVTATAHKLARII